MPSTLLCQTCGSTLAETPTGLFCPACALAADEDMNEGAGATHDGFTLPRMFGGYELLAEIGHGGMGLVFKARQRSLGRIVALKVLLTGRFSDRTARERFHREAASAARLQHPNIVAIHEFGEAEGHPYLTMDFIAGKNLAELCEGRALPPRQAAEYLRDIARALHAAHAASVLHRDLKPSNILVGGDGRPRITDFGLARLADDQGNLTLTGQMLGSPNYASPEQAAGHRERIGTPTDVYGLGAVLFHLATGRPPFVAATAGETLRLVLAGDVVSPRRLNPALPPEIETIALKCLREDPSRRYASAAEVADDLENFLHDRPLRARPPTRGYVMRKFVRRNRLLVSAALTVVAILVAGISFSGTFWRREREANRRVQAARAQSDNLMNLLLRDVRPSLEQFGRVTELDRFAEETVRYLAELEPEVRDDAYAGNRAIALSVLAWVRWRAGDFDGASAVARESLDWRQRVLDASLVEFRRIAPLMRDVIGLRNSGCALPAVVRPRAEANVRRLRELVAEHPDDPYVVKELAIELIGIGVCSMAPDTNPSAGRIELVEAKQLMRRVLDRSPEDPLFSVIYADALLDLSWVNKYCADYDGAVREAGDAVACLEDACKSRPGNLLLLEHLAQSTHDLAAHWAPLSLARAREVELAARKHFAALTQADPEHDGWREMFAYSHTIEAWCLFNEGRFAESRAALATFKSVCASFPATHQWTNPMLRPWRHIEDGRAAAALGDLAGARESLREARALFDQVIASRAPASRLEAKNRVGAWLGEATLLADLGDWPRVDAAASEAADRAEAFGREHPPEEIPRLERADARRFLGLARLHQNRAAEALAPLREALALYGAALPVRHPFTSRELRIAETQDALGEALLQLGQHEEARRVLESALDFREDDLARQPDLASTQAAFAKTALLVAESLKPDGDADAGGPALLARAANIIARAAAENRLTEEARQTASRLIAFTSRP